MSELCAGTAVAVPQDEALASYAAKVFKEDGYVDWNHPLAAVHAQIRGVTPFPGARTLLRGEGLAEPLLMQIWPGQPEAFTPGEEVACGSVRRDKAGLSVACADGWYRLGRVRPPAKKEMDALALCNGLLQKMPLGISGTASCPEAYILTSEPRTIRASFFIFLTCNSGKGLLCVRRPHRAKFGHMNKNQQ